MIRDIWKPAFFWNTGVTNIWEQYKHPYNYYGTANKNVYFTHEQCLSGVSYTYIISLNDVYKKDIMTNEDTYSLYNQYNQFDVIERVTSNYTQVDVATNTNTTLTTPYYKIDGVRLKPEQKILLYGQTNKVENDVYTVNNNYKLINSGLLITSGQCEKFYTHVKLGENRDKFYFLNYTGFTNVLMSGDTKTFIEGKPYILKNILTYNLDTPTPKILFTDYNIPRKLVDNTVYDDIVFQISSASTFSRYILTYKHDTHATVAGTNLSYTTQIYISGATIVSGVSYVDGDTRILAPFPANVFNAVENYIEISFPNTSAFTMRTHVKEITGEWLHLYDQIPQHLFFNGYTGDTIRVDSLVRTSNLSANFAITLDKFTNKTPLKYFYNVNYDTTANPRIITISPNVNEFKHFDYSLLNIEFKMSTAPTGFTGKFYTSNKFINYKLYETLNNISSTYTSTYPVYNTFSLTSFISAYEKDIITIAPTNVADMNYFREFTYVNVVSSFGVDQTSLIVYKTDTYFIIEKPANFGALTPSVTSVDNIYELKEVSDILYDVYLNDPYTGYTIKGDNICKQICKAYGKILDESDLKYHLSGTTSGITGLIYESGDYNNYVFKLYNMDYDTSLNFVPADIIELGCDLKSRFPVPAKIKP